MNKTAAKTLRGLIDLVRSDPSLLPRALPRIASLSPRVASMLRMGDAVETKEEEDDVKKEASAGSKAETDEFIRWARNTQGT